MSQIGNRLRALEFDHNNTKQILLAALEKRSSNEKHYNSTIEKLNGKMQSLEYEIKSSNFVNDNLYEMLDRRIVMGYIFIYHPTPRKFKPFN